MLDNLGTEKRNKNTMNLDKMSSLEFVQVMNNEDQKVALAIKEILPQIAIAIDLMTERYLDGGRVIYMGAGTSGRLGILDAVECVPTFSVGFDDFIGLIAGGESAMIKAVEGAEDSLTLGEEDLKNLNLSEKDVVIGIAASGRTPYVIGGLKYANQVNSLTIAVCCNKNTEIGKLANTAIEVDCGPEILTGSTRLKSGTAQKLILNMLSTGTMVKSGKVYGNLMVDVKPTNEKLVERAKRIIIQATGVDYDTASNYFNNSNQSPKIAIVMIKNNCSYDEAVKKLKDSNGFITNAIK